MANDAPQGGGDSRGWVEHQTPPQSQVLWVPSAPACRQHPRRPINERAPINALSPFCHPRGSGCSREGGTGWTGKHPGAGDDSVGMKDPRARRQSRHKARGIVPLLPGGLEAPRHHARGRGRGQEGSAERQSSRDLAARLWNPAVRPTPRQSQQGPSPLPAKKKLRKTRRHPAGPTRAPVA